MTGITRRKRVEEMLASSRTWLPVVYAFVLLYIVVWLNEFVDLPHLLMGAPSTPINWRKALIEMILVAAVGLFAVSRLMRDVTERQRAEEALQASVQQWQSTFDAVGDAVCLMDLESRFRRCNKAMVELLGKPLNEIVGGTCWELVHGTSEPIQGCPIPRMQETRRRETLVLPIDDRWLGVSVDPVLDEDGKLVGAVHIISDITERKRAEETLRQRTAQLEALRSVGLELTAELDLDTLLRSIASQAIGLLGGAAGGLDLYRPERDLLEWTVAVGFDVSPLGIVLHRGEGLSGKVWETGEPLIVDDYQHWEGRAAAWEGYPIPAAVGVPVRWGEEFLGVLNVASDSPCAFSPADADLLGLFATQAAVAIRNARLYEAERKQATQLAVVNQVARKAVSILDPAQLLQDIVTAIQQGFEYYNVILLQLDKTARELGRQAIAGGYEDMAAPDYRQAMGVGLIGWAAETGQPILANDVSQEPRYIPGFLEEVPTRSELCVPLKLAGEVVGVLDVQDTRLNGFDETDLTALETLADQIAAAIENARLYEEVQQELAERTRMEKALRRRNRDLALLNRVNRAFISTLNLDQVLVNVLEEVRRLLDVVACSIWLIDPATDELVCRQATGPQNEMVRGWRLAPEEGIAGRVAHTGESLIVPDAWANEHYFKGVDQQTGLVLRSILTVPLRVKSGVIGVLQVVDTAVGRFDTTDLELLEPLVTPAAIAIENARLYEQARQDAETRSVLLREVNHRVKNNLSAIIGLLYAERRRAGVEGQAVYQPIMQDLVNRVQGLATVHSMLSDSEWAPLLLSELADQVVHSSLEMLPRDKRVSVDVVTSPVRVTPDQAHNLALVISEMATNTVKHTLQQRDTAHIAVRIALDDDTVLFEFRDDGPGYPEEILGLERPSVGFDLIQNIVRKNLRGELSLHNDRGAVAVIRFTAQV